jgi:hypothetical protein
MAVYVNTTMAIAVNQLQAAGYVSQLELAATAETKEITTFASNGFRQYAVGLATYTLAMSGYQDQTGPSPATLFTPTTLSGGAADSFTISVPGTTVADPAFIGTAIDTQQSEMAQVGEVAGWSGTWAGTGRVIKGQLLHPAAARTSTGNGTTATFTTPTATQSLWASFHVHSVTGTGTITFTVQTDDNSGMSSATTRITSTAFAAVGGEVKSLAGALAGETHIRVVYTISGFSSVTFTVAAGVA